MDENHQDAAESKLIAAEDIRWALNKRSNLLVPKQKKRTGFEDKTSWDWLLLCAQVVGAFTIPLSIIALIIGMWQFNAQQISGRQKTADQQKTEFQNLKDQQQQTTLETYLDRMSDLLFTQHLNTSKEGDEVRQVARARTLTALQNLNAARKGVLLQFLYESALIRKDGLFVPSPSKGSTADNNPIIDLFSADLSFADLSGADLYGAVLSGAVLSGADLSGAVLSDAYLRGANLRGANLRGAYLIGADLSGVVLSGVDLSGADLIGVDLSGADLSGADLSGADLRGADLREANLSGAHLSCISSNGRKFCIQLRGANLRGTKVTSEQLAQASSLQGATMPDGSKHP